jgi:hypothetical protein
MRTGLMENGMNKQDMDSSGRPLRWYEWLLLLLLMSLAAGVRAQALFKVAPVYKCTTTHGDIAFQDSPCATTKSEAVVDIAPAPAYVASPAYAIDRRPQTTATARSRGQSSPSREHDSSSVRFFECRATDGQVFYRHSPCPHSIASATPGATKGRGRNSAQSVGVTSYHVSREEACTQMRRAGAIGRSGHAYDEDVSTYDKNLGRDPCR